jgi:hypothetical protein
MAIINIVSVLRTTGTSSNVVEFGILVIYYVYSLSTLQSSCIDRESRDFH